MISHTELDDRTNTLVALLENSEHLSDGLPERVKVSKGPHQVNQQGPAEPLEVFVSRMGLPRFEYGISQDPVIVTQRMAIGAVVQFPDDRETMETWMSYLAANVMRVLIENSQVRGDEGWFSGVIRRSDAVRFRNAQTSMYELEVFEFEIRFEVDQ